MSVALEGVVADEPHFVARSTLEVVVDPVDEVVVSLVRVDVVGDLLVALEQLPVLLVQAVDLGRVLADVALLKKLFLTFLVVCIFALVTSVTRWLYNFFNI